MNQSEERAFPATMFAKVGFGIAYPSLPKAILQFLLVLFLGWTGVHKFAKRKIWQGILYLCTMGVFYVGWAFDAISAIVSVIRTAQGSTPYTAALNDIAPQKTLDVPTDSAPAIVEPEATIDLSNLSPLEDELVRVDAMSADGHAFEHYCADILKQLGYSNVQVTAGSGDFGIDILADKESVTYAIQCKCYSHPVGNKAVQEAFSGKEYYRRMVGVVVTNNTFTSAALKTASETRVLLWDRSKLREMIVAAKPELSAEANEIV